MTLRSTGTAPGLESEASQLRPWGGLWISVALACLAAAIWQWVELAGRINHLAWYAVKVGIQPHLIDAGTFMIAVFFAATAVFAAFGTVATAQLRRLESGFQCCSLLSVLMLLEGALIWGGLLASPLVQIVSR